MVFVNNKRSKSSSISLFHTNTCPINKNLYGLEYVLKTTHQNFNIVAKKVQIKQATEMLQTILCNILQLKPMEMKNWHANSYLT